MRDTLSWQKILSQGFTSAGDLLYFLELPITKGSALAEQQFPSRIPVGFAKRMKKGDPKDPLLLQVLAVGEELENTKNYVLDTLEEKNAIPLKGLIHKYYGRVLLIMTGTCAVNCRYCFRRHFPYQGNNPGRSGWKEVANYIAKDTSITEVILSGGDPLLASNVVLAELIQQLEQIAHLHTVRIHTRIPIVLPERIEKGLLSILKSTRLKKIIVLHSNHPQELDARVRKACYDLQQSGCFLLNQSVLLAGVNDNAAILAQLSQDLLAHGVLPYYLHVLDKIRGNAHFDLPFSKAQAIYQELQTLLPGYLLPRMVREEAGKASKTLLI